MRRCVKAVLHFSSKEARDSALAEIQTDLSKKKVQSGAAIPVDSDEQGPAWIISETVRFEEKDKADGDDHFKQLKEKKANTTMTKVRMSIHNCTHDDPVVLPCILEEVDVK